MSCPDPMVAISQGVPIHLPPVNTDQPHPCSCHNTAPCTPRCLYTLYSTLSHANIVVNSLGCDKVSVEDRLQVTLEANTVQCSAISYQPLLMLLQFRPRVSPPRAACQNKTETSITTTANCKYKRLINSFMGAF